MEKKTVRFIIILFAVLIQISALGFIFADYFVPSLVVALVVAWTIHVGFMRILPWIIALGITLDIASFQPVGINVVLFVLISYFVSFFSRRFMVEHRIWGALVAVFFIIISTTFYYSANIVMAGFGDFTHSFGGGRSLFWKSLAAQISGNTLLFALIYFPLKKIEEFILFYEGRVKIK